MDTLKFSFNRDAKYQTGDVFSPQDLAKLLTQPDVQVQTGSSFQTLYPDVFQKYRLPPVKSDKIVQAWNTNPMQFWQTQVNFAVWCATTGSGVSAKDHLAVGNPLMKALFNFHIYYQIRRILTEIQTPLPQDQAWTLLDNPYDRRAYECI